MLSKHPVTYQGKDYRVDILEERIAHGIHHWVVVIYKRVARKPTLFNKSKYKDVRLHVKETGWNYYHYWNGKFVELAANTVREFHEKIEKQNLWTMENEEGIAKWNSWNGNIPE